MSVGRRQIRAAWRARLLGAPQSGATPPIGAVMRHPAEPARVALHIGELRMNAFSRRDAHKIAGWLQASLASLLQVQGLPLHWRFAATIDSMKLDQVRLARPDKPQVIGEALARALLVPGREHK
ncbi:MAG: hypothetical protein ACR2IF_07280 [Terriglobales bacterium]